MGLIEWLVLAVLALFAACLRGLLTDEVKAWMPWLVEKLVLLAVARAPAQYRERFAEEWSSHVDETPGNLSKLWVALSLLWGSGKLPNDAKPADAEPDDVREPTMEEILASIRRIVAEGEIVEASEFRGGRPGDFAPWPPICNVSQDRNHRVPSAAIYFSARNAARTFQGPCSLCHEWIDTGECADD